MRRWWPVMLVALASACGGGGSAAIAPSVSPTPASAAAVVLEAAGFEGRVSKGVSLVEFHSPT